MFLKEYNPRRQNLSWFKLNSVQFSSCFRSLDAADSRNVARIELPGSEERPTQRPPLETRDYAMPVS